jgi:hypothetical protein
MTNSKRAARLAFFERVLGFPVLLVDRRTASVTKKRGDALVAGRASTITNPLAHLLVDKPQRVHDHVYIPPGWETKVKCSRCGGMGRIGAAGVERVGTVQWDEPPAECLDRERCRWPCDVADGAR